VFCFALSGVLRSYAFSLNSRPSEGADRRSTEVAVVCAREASAGTYLHRLVARARAEGAVARRAAEARIAVGFVDAGQAAFGATRRGLLAALALWGVTGVRTARDDTSELPDTVVARILCLPRVAAGPPAVSRLHRAGSPRRHRILAIGEPRPGTASRRSRAPGRRMGAA
jgi:hypothetical protein